MAPFEEPGADNDWLLDIRLYGRSFRADSVSILFDELGLSSQRRCARTLPRVRSSCVRRTVWSG